jgi:hypothetical protein
MDQLKTEVVELVEEPKSNGRFVKYVSLTVLPTVCYLQGGIPRGVNQVGDGIP